MIARTIRVALMTLLLLPARARAQTPIVEAQLTIQQADSLVSFFNREGTTRLTGDARLSDPTQTGDVAMLGGELTIAAHVTGSVVVINGSVRFEPGSRVDGDVHVIGGPIVGAENANARSITIYRELIRYDLQDGVLIHRSESLRDELRAGRQFEFGRFDFVIAARGSFNRVEGLPVHLGPRVALGHSNPTVFDATAIVRTAEFDEPGFILKVEQYIGGRRAARVGFRWADEVIPIEPWGLSNTENSLAAFLIHRDYRDHFLRDGWSAYLRLGREGLPVGLTVAYSEFDVATADVNDPFTILYNDDPWRAQPLVDAARFTTLTTDFRYDTRNDQRDPAAGWLASVGVELELKGSERYRYGLADIRRYARLSPNAKLSLRGVVAGSINGEALPTFRQQSLGGEASLPAYELHQFDCGGHVLGIYGCDRLALVQVEYQSNFRALSRVARQVGRDFGLLDNIKWVAFVNSGRAWVEPEGTTTTPTRNRGLSDFVTDAGVGLRFGVLGVYWAFPLSDRGTSANFFVRLGPRL
jgi:hypothetical protein